MDGYCVGEPWGNRAIVDKIGFTAETTQAIWKDHPEKTLGTTAEWVQKNPNSARAMYSRSANSASPAISRVPRGSKADYASAANVGSVAAGTLHDAASDCRYRLVHSPASIGRRREATLSSRTMLPAYH